MAEIVVLGSLNMDLSISVPRIPSPGETLSGGRLITSAGGKGANQAAACARLGMQVAMAGCVGQDDFGRHLKSNLQAMGVDVTHVKEEAHASSGTALILVDADGENVIVLSAGANQEVSLDPALRGLITGARLLILQLEISPAVVYQAIEIAFAAGVPVLLNPAPAIELPSEVYARTDTLILNETEAELLTGVCVIDSSSAEKAVDILLGRGTRVVIITLGSEGAYAATKQFKKYIPAFAIETVDSTGAGDAFIGGFASAIVEGKDLETALTLASAGGALAATKIGAQASLPNRKEVENFLSQNPEQKEVSAYLNC